MSDLHQAIADALRKHHASAAATWQCGGCDWEGPITGEGPWVDHAADVLLSLPGIAIVELPEPVGEDPNRFQGGGYECCGDTHIPGGMVRAGIGPYMSPQSARRAASALLAAAAVAETAPPIKCRWCGSTDPDRVHYGHCPTIGGR